MEPIIELKNVTKKFGGIIALDSASLHVDKGEVVGRGRALYHFVKWNKSFLKWKIYMISDLDVE